MGGSKGTSTSTTRPPKEIMDAYKKSIGLAEQAIGQPYQQYQGQLVAGLNPTQMQGISNVNAAQGAALPFIQQGAQYTNRAAQGVNPEMINQFMSPYLSNVVNATQRNLLETNAQQQAALKAGAIQAGAFGGDRSRFAQAEMARQQGLAGGQVIGGLLNQGFGQALSGAQQNIQNMLQGGQMLGTLGQTAQQSLLSGAQAQLAAGAQQQATEQAQLQSAYDQFLQRQAYPFQQAQFFANIAQGIGAGAGGTTQQTPAAPNAGSQILGALTALGSIYSDERVKENIQPVGKTNDGQNIYKYNYKGDPKTHIGLLAQEVEKKHPEAVSSLGGIKMVDYDKATEGSERAEKAFGGSSMGGLVTPDMERQAFAQGGFGAVPYADFMKGISYVPSGEMTYRGQSPGSTLPKGFSWDELEKIAEGSSFDELNAMSEKDIARLKAGLGKMGGDLQSVLGLGAAPNLPPMTGTPYAHWARGGLVRHGYATDGAVDEYVPPSQEDVQNYIIQAAKAKGVNPDEALKVYAAEGLAGDPTENWQSKIVADGKREESYGPFQLNMGPQGVGTIMLKETGLDPRDPKNWQAGVDYALGHAAKHGWRDWMGAQKIGLAEASTPSEGTGLVVEPSAATPSSSDADISPERERTILENILGRDVSDQARTGMLAAGLAMLGGRSPYFGVNVGKGALAGMNAYYKGLENQRENAVKAMEMAKTQAETATSDQARMLALNSAWLNYNFVRALSGQPEVTFEEYMEIFKQQRASAPALGPSPAMPTGAGAPPPGSTQPAPSEAGEPTTGETSAAPGAEEGDETAAPAETPAFIPGGDPKKSGTLNFYQDKLATAQNALKFAAGDTNRTAQAQAQIDAARAAIDKITSSPFYIQQQKATGPEYDDMRMTLKRMAELNANFQGGRGSPQIAELVSVARTLGLTNLIPADIRTNPDAYDELLKYATTIAVQQAQDSGLLKAPGQALEAESKIVPTPEMSPGARYELTVKALAIADRNRDLYSGWDTSPDTNTYIAKWQAAKAKEAKEAGYSNYMDMYLENAKKELPAPATGLPTEIEPRISNALDRRYPNAPDGSKITSPDGKVAVKRDGQWVWEE